MNHPQCILCQRICPADVDYCLPECHGRKTGYAHFFCHACWDHTLSRVKCELASCTGCHIGMPGFRIPVHPVGPVIEDVGGDDLDMTD